MDSFYTVSDVDQLVPASVDLSKITGVIKNDTVKVNDF